MNYMNETLPMLESHPHVVRYSWYSTTSEFSVSDLGGFLAGLYQLGHLYNDYSWDGKPNQNPQWFYPNMSDSCTQKILNEYCMTTCNYNHARHDGVEWKCFETLDQSDSLGNHCTDDQGS